MRNRKGSQAFTEELIFMYYIASIEHLISCKHFISLNSCHINKVYDKSVNFGREKQKII